MRITSLTLENIKSYQRATVEFTTGLNAVCGSNGSGKTTVLEAIGYALFDYLPYTQASFLREGERSGTVRVRLLAGDDREYEVVRKIGGGSAYFVVDMETGIRLADRRDNVLDWIRTHALGIDTATDLEALFQNAVGVPQGRMTAEFLAKESQRKGVFDPLLRVEEYGKAWETLRDTDRYLRDLAATVRQEIARFEGETARIPDQAARVTELEGTIQWSTQEVEKLAATLHDITRDKERLDGIANRRNGLEKDLVAACAEARRQEDRLVVEQESLERARRARLAVEQSEPGYRQVLAARLRLEELEVQRRERDRLMTALAEARSSRQGIYGNIESLDAQVRQAEQAGDGAAGLITAVERQTTLEAELQEAQARLREIPSLQRQIGALHQEIGAIERSRTDREARLAQARRAQTEAKRLDAVTADLQDLDRRLGALQTLQARADEVKVEGVRLRSQYDALTGQVSARSDLLRRAGEVEKDAAQLDELLRRGDSLREERARVAGTLDYQAVARAELGRHHCPLLELQCPAVTADRSLLGRFEDRMGALKQRHRSLEAEISRVSARIAGARSASQTLQTLQVEAAKLDGCGQQLAEVERRLESCRKEYRTLSESLTEGPQLIQSQKELRAEQSRLREAADLTAQLPLLHQEQERDGHKLQEKGEQLRCLHQAREALVAVEATARTLGQELESLGNPRKQQSDLLAVAARRPDLERQIVNQQERLKEAAGRVHALQGQLQKFDSLDAELETQTGLEQDNRADHDRYVTHKEEAAQVGEREGRVAEAARLVEELQSGVQSLQVQLHEVEALYDIEQHAEVQRQYDLLRESVAAERKNGEHWAAQLAAARTELERLHEQERRRLAKEAELNDLEALAGSVKFVRETIKAAGPAITETLLANISQIANDIYAEIMDDHAAELRWERDYDVLVQRGPESRRFVQLSGGEQMSAALSVRLALLKEMSDVDFAFFDEPTQNMDGDRRANLAEQIRAVRGFDQLIVISHDDTFEHHTDNLIRLRKMYEATEIEGA